MLSCGLLAAHAQDTCSYRLEGTVADHDNGDALAFAILLIEPDGKQATADSLGRFEVSNLCQGKKTVTVRHFGCHDMQKVIFINQPLTTLNVWLDHSTHQMEEVVISDHRLSGETGQSVARLEKMELLVRRGMNLGQTVESLDGVSLLQTGSNISKPMVHGMHSNRLLILNNEIRQEGQQWGAEHAPEIDPMLAERIELVKGASTVKYGPEAIAGVMLIAPAPLPSVPSSDLDLFSGYQSNGHQYTQSAKLSGKLNKVLPIAYRLQGTLKRGGTLHTPDYKLANTAMRELNYSWALGYQRDRWQTELFYSRFTTDIGIFSGAHLGNTTDLVRAYSRPNIPDTAQFSYDINRPYQSINHELLKASFQTRLGNLNTLKINLSRQFNRRFEYDRDLARNDSIAALNNPELQYFLTTYLLDVEYKLHHHNHFDGSIGIQGLYQFNTFRGRQFVPNFFQRGFSLFAVERYHWSDYYAEVGARYDVRDFDVYRSTAQGVRNDRRTYQRPTLSLGLNRRKNQLDLGVHIANAWRAPAVNELYSNGLHHGSATIEVGNQNLGTERVWHGSLSLAYEHPLIDFEVNPHFNRFANYISLVPSGQNTLTIRGAFPTYQYVEQAATIYGVDAHAKASLSESLKINLQCLVVRGVDSNTKQWLVLQPADRYRAALLWQQKNTSVTLGVSWVAQQTRYPEQITLVQQNGQILTLNDFAPPPKDYTLLDLQWNWSIKKRGEPVVVSLSVNNLLNRRYRDYLNRFRYFSDEIGRNVQIKLSVPLNLRSK